MKELNKQDISLFEKLVHMNQKEVASIMSKFLKELYTEQEVIVADEYIIAKGTIPIALLAHMDTVADENRKQSCLNLLYDKDKGLMTCMYPAFDDRAGIFLILKLLQKGFRPTVILTTDEELGCIGATFLTQEFPDPITDLKYLIQLDRRGKSDCVFYDCDNPDFVKYVESFGFIEAIGSYTDISIIAPAWGVAAVNLSVGYENEHSYQETLNVPALLRTFKRVAEMLMDADNALRYKFIPAVYKNYYYDQYGWDDFDEQKCAGCGGTFFQFEMLPVTDPDTGKEIYFCGDCCETKVGFCEYPECGEAYPITKKHTNKTYCQKCAKKIMGRKKKNAV